MMKRFSSAILAVALLGLTTGLAAQAMPPAEIAALITRFKTDPRGPYQAIRWFCPDGTILPPDQRCAQPGGIQHALPRDVVQRLARENGIYLGQILAGTPYPAFWDAANGNSRARQYLLEQYLKRADDGWILRRARYYRGAVQAEDESAWARAFLLDLLAMDDPLLARYYLVRQLVRDLPLRPDTNRWDRIRTLSLVLADSLPDFMPVRIKLHGLPEPGDLETVRTWRRRNARLVTPSLGQRFDQLEADLTAVFAPFQAGDLDRYVTALGNTSPVTPLLRNLQRGLRETTTLTAAQRSDVAVLLRSTRAVLLQEPDPERRLALLTLSLDLENLLFREMAASHDATLDEAMDRFRMLAEAAAGCGYLELWEYAEIAASLRRTGGDHITVQELTRFAESARRVVDWGSGTVRANFAPAVQRFAPFEPLAPGVVDDRVRGSLLLPMGDLAALLRRTATEAAGISDAVMDLPGGGQFLGLNPGFALATLAVVDGPADHIDFNDRTIYLLDQVPADLKPVAGIATVSEGNLVSHVQLLARNLGIPNAVLTRADLLALKPYAGREVFYAVSPAGRVVLKPAEAMTPAERALVDVRTRPRDRVTVDASRIDLDRESLVTLSELRARDSGRLSGPKAANLGELKSLFPERVVEGFAIPFGIFRRHMDQPMPGTATSYWGFLQETFTQADRMRRDGADPGAIEKRIVERLEQLRGAIRTMPLFPDFQKRIEDAFTVWLGHPIGKVPVFIRSDTNMEDLKDFTGAGLNLTVFNVVEREAILQGIRDVWASPYTERSYRWRQQYLTNPENVYPSILILPSVNVDKSGVMITTGVNAGGSRDDLTVAFSRGAGGAVEGQAAESWLLRPDGERRLLSPAREIQFTTLPATGGTGKRDATFETALLSAEDLATLRRVAGEIRDRLRNAPGVEGERPWDIELGFMDGKLWLFQVRPFVENRRARSSAYLRGLDPAIDGTRRIPLNREAGR